MTERIIIPREVANRAKPINLEFSLNSFPQHEFALQMEWNSVRSRWTLELIHLDRDWTITRGYATPYRVYSYMPWVTFFFMDSSGTENAVLPSNLGDEMHLYAAPGPSGRPVEEWV